MICRLRLTRQSWLAEVHKQTTQSPDLDGRFAPPIRKLSVLFLGPDFLMLQFIHSNFCFSSAPSCCQFWGTSSGCMRHRHCTPKTTTTWEKMGKSQHKCSPTFQSWGSELSTQEIAIFKIKSNKRILARRISPHTQNLLQGCIWWLADAQTRLFMGSQWCYLVKALQCCLIWF